MEPLFEHRMRVDGYETRALELEGDGPGVVLLHGYADSADTWRPLLHELGQHERRAIAVDLPGFGAASRLGSGAILPQYDAFAGALVSEWGRGEEVLVAGNSLGGVVALRLAERADLALAGIVPIAPAGLEMPRWFEIIDRDPVLRTLLSLPVPIPEPAIRTAVGAVYRQLAFSSPAKADGAVIRAFTGHHSSREKLRGMLATGRRLLPELTPPPFDFDAIDCPVLLVWGTRDHMVPHSGARVLEDALGKNAQVQVELIEGCGHCPQLECPPRVAELLLAFAESATA